jgi:YfiH family protein
MSYAPTAVNPNRLQLFASLGMEPERVHARVQTHSLDVAVAGEGDDRPGDGLVSNDPSCALSVTIADCLPIFLLDIEHSCFAVLHSGWKGTGIVLGALSLMAERWGTRGEAVTAILGPCIRSCCYAVENERASAYEATFRHEGPPETSEAASPLGPVVRRDGGRSYIDLQAANARLLKAAGVRDLAVCEDCTYTDDRLGSFRREGPGRFTRMIAVAGRFFEENS